MDKEKSKEFWIDIYWKNRDDPMFENLTRFTRDCINNSLKNNFIVERGGTCRIENNRLHLEFTKLPSKKEIEEWEHFTRFKSVQIKAVIGIDTWEIKVDQVNDIVVKEKSLIIRGSEQLKSTLFCFIKDNKIMCELYEGFPHERVNTNQIRFIGRGEIDRLKRVGYELVKEDELGAIFKIKPLRVEKVDSIIFEGHALIYSKQHRERVLNICINPSKSQVEGYQ